MKEIEKEDMNSPEEMREREINKKWEDFRNYLRASVFVGIIFGVGIGWMWGLKGLILGPIIGIIEGFILSIIFTFYKKNFWVRD